MKQSKTFVIFLIATAALVLLASALTFPSYASNNLVLTQATFDFTTPNSWPGSMAVISWEDYSQSKQPNLHLDGDLLTPIITSKVKATHAFGGSPWSVAGNASHLYYNEGADIVIADITNPQSPVELGRWSNEDKTGFADIQVSNNLLYLPHQFAGVEIVDVSNAANPSAVGNIPILFIGGSAYAISDIEVSGSYAYALQGNLFRVIDVTIPTSPINTGVITPTTGIMYSLVVSGNYAYVAAGSNGLLVIDVSTPSTPALVGSYNTPGFAYYIAKQGQYVYVADNDAIRVINIVVPGSPTEVGSYQATNFYPDRNLAISGQYLYARGNIGQEFRVINISNPASPVGTGVLQAQPLGSGLYLSGGRAYLGTATDGLQIINVSSPSSPTSVALIGDMVYATSIVRLSSGALVASNEHLWYVQYQPGTINATAVWTSSLDIRSLVVANNLAYTVQSDDNGVASDLQILNVQDVNNPTSLATLPLSIQGSSHIIKNGSYVYVASWHGISAVNVANPNSPTETFWTTLPSGVNARGLDIGNNHLFVATTNGLKVYGLSNPASPNYVGELPGVNTQDVAVAGNYAYLAMNSAQQVQVINISNPSTPTFVRALNACGAGGDVAVANNHLYLANGCQQLALYNVTNPASGSSYPISYAGMPGFGNEVILNGDEVLVTAGAGGFVRLERFESVSDYIPVSGGNLTSPDGTVVITVPANTYTGTVWLRYDEEPDMTTGNLVGTGDFFSLTAAYTSTWTLAPLPAGESLSVAVSYSNPGPIIESTLKLYRWEGTTWNTNGISSTVNPAVNRVMAEITSFSGEETFGLLGEVHSSYLPLMLK